MEFTLKTKINAGAANIYETWLSSEGHTNMTGGKATITDKIGEPFTAWDGYIVGKNIDLEANKRILQSWRTSEFKDHQEDSQVEILLKEVDGQCELTLIHNNVPEGGEQYIQGWKDHYFQPMQEYFSNQKVN